MNNEMTTKEETTDKELVIWKYELQAGTESANTVTLPLNAQILTIAGQHEALVLWAKADPNETRKETREFVVMVTGLIMPAEFYDGLDYCETVQLEGGAFVVHVFERRNARREVENLK